MAAALCAVLAVACGGAAGEGPLRPASLYEGSGSFATKSPEQVERVFEAELSPVNTGVASRNITGVVRLVAGDSKLKAHVEVIALTDGDHPMHVHGFANRDSLCPGTRADQNGDGLVDAQEMQAAVGPHMFPLTEPNAMATKRPGSGAQPLEWTRAVPIDELRLELAEKGYDGLRLAQRTVVVHGVGKNRKLPASVAALAGHSPSDSLPVACGILMRVR